MDTSTRDYYYVLGLDNKNCSAEDIKRQYHKLAKEFHPDRTRGDKVKEKKFIEIRQAYDTLSNTEQRSMYDMTSNDDEMFENFAHLFSFIPTGGNEEKKQPVLIDVDVDEYLHGVIKEVSVQQSEPCVTCNETGIHDYQNNVRACTTCHSLGIDLNIPLFACGMCAGRGFTVIDNIHCKKCRGQGQNEITKNHFVQIPSKTSHNTIITQTGGYSSKQNNNTEEMEFKINHVFKNNLDENDDVIIIQEISLIKWLCGSKLKIQTYSGKYIHTQTKGAFDLSSTWAIENHLILQFKLVMNIKVLNILRKCKPIFMKIFRVQDNTTSEQKIDVII